MNSILKEKIDIAKMKVERAKNQLKIVEQEYDNLRWHLELALEDIEDEVDKAQDGVVKAKKEYKDLLEKVANKKINKPKNMFEKKFLIAAHFCEKDNNSRFLDYVKIDDDELTACDGYAMIKMKCNSIPTNLQNRFVKWDSLDFDDIDDILEDDRGIYPDLALDKVIKQARQKSPNFKKLTKSDIISEVLNGGKVINKPRKEIILNFDGTKIIFNYNYIKYAIQGFDEDGRIIVRWKDNESPIILESNQVKVFILPIRYPSEIKENF